MRKLLVGLAAGAFLAVGVAVPSDAEVVVVNDGRDTAAKQELLGVRINHGKRVIVTLQYSSSFALHAEYPYSILFDTKRHRHGAEFGYFSHFANVFTVRHGQFARKVPCSIRGRADDERHTIRLSFAHKCLRGDTGPLRVRVAAFAKTTPDQRVITDYAPGRHRWSEPVRRG